MSSTNYKINDVDLSTLFNSYISGGLKVTSTNYKINGVDLCDILAPFSSGNARSNILIKVNNVDISTLFQPYTTWTALGTSSLGGTTPSCTGIAYDSASGYIYICGTFTSVNDVATNNVAVWNGTAWNALGSIGICNDILFVSSNEIYAGGLFVTNNRIARWNGTAWGGMGNGFNNNVIGIARDNSGRIYAGGVFTRPAGGTSGEYNRIAMWNGTAWNRIPFGSSFGQNGFNANCQSLAYNSTNGYLYFGGGLTGFYNKSATLTTCNRVGYYDGTNFQVMGSGVNGTTVYAVEISSNGNVYIGGDFTVANGNVNCKGVAMWNITNNSWNPLGNGLTGTVQSLKWNNGFLYAGGSFTTLGDGTTVVNYIAVYNGVEWSVINQSLNGTVYSINIGNSNKLLVGGAFTTPFKGFAVY